MDEPLSNLDAKLRVQTRTQIAALQRRLGTTTVYVTHDQVEAMTMGDRVAVLRDGKLQQFASPNELYNKPANAFVAGFIGSPAMNLMTVPITSDGVRIGEDSTLELERDQLTLLHDAGLDDVTVGMRPEHLELSRVRRHRVIVDLVEDLGSESYIYTHAKPDVDLVARCMGRVPAKLADTVRLRKSPDGVVHLFNPDTGERIKCSTRSATAAARDRSRFGNSGLAPGASWVKTWCAICRQLSVHRRLVARAVRHPVLAGRRRRAVQRRCAAAASRHAANDSRH